MARWHEVEDAAPDLARRARAYLEARTHLTIATLRRDRSPRISGIELRLLEGEAWLGMMGGSVKALDLRRDPRFALHSGSEDPPAWRGDAKLAGRAEEVLDEAMIARINGPHAPEAEPSHLFRLDVKELVVVELGEPRDHLVIESWHEGRGLRRVERR